MKKKRPTFEDIVENLSEGVVSVSASMTVTVFNQSAEKITETSRALAVGSPLSEAMRRNPWLVDVMEKSLDTGKLYTDFEGTLIRGFSEPIQVGVTTYRVYDDDGLLCGAAALIKDLSLYNSLQVENHRKERLSYIGTFAANLAHEVRNPLSGIRGAAQLVERRVDDVKIKECAEVIIREADRLNLIVSDMLNFARSSELVRVPLNIHKLIDKADMLLGEGKKGFLITVAKEFDPSLPPVMGDAGGLTQVLLNLIKNAREAAGKDGEVKVVTRMVTDFHISLTGTPSDKFAAIEIKDNGPGIPAEEMENVFTPFFTTKPRGSGLGLPISFRIVKEHGGFMKIDSVVGEGTRVLLYLPTTDKDVFVEEE